MILPPAQLPADPRYWRGTTRTEDLGTTLGAWGTESRSRKNIKSGQKPARTTRDIFGQIADFRRVFFSKTQ